MSVPSDLEANLPKGEPPVSESLGDEGPPQGATRRTFFWAAGGVALLTGPLVALVRRLSRPTLRVAVDGPFLVNKSVRIKLDTAAAPGANRPGADVPATAGGDGGASRFVKPDRVVLRELGPDSAIISVGFSFLGQERPKRRIELTLRAKDSAGRVVTAGTHVCADQRIAAREQVHLGPARGVLSIRNLEKFPVPPNAAATIARLELTFREI